MGAPRLRVELTVLNPPREGLTLRGHAAREILRVHGFSARSVDGRAFRVESRVEPVVVDKAIIDLPTFHLPGPLPSRLEIRYDVEVGNREGDAHQGFSGRRHGFIGGDFAFFTGRQVFLIPQALPSIGRVTVRVEAPRSRTTITPWRRRGDTWWPGVGGGHAMDDLLAGAVGVGDFRLRGASLGRTRFECAFLATTPAEEEERAFTALVSAARFLHDRFGRQVARRYRVLVLPKSPEGDELVGDGWATGQGGTLLPFTPSRLAAFSREFLDAHLRDAPYRPTLEDRAEFWLVDGLRELYAWRAVAAAGLLGREDVDQRMALRYASEIEDGTWSRDLERLYDNSSPGASERETLAPFVLDLLDRRLRTDSGGRDSLDRVVRQFVASGGSIYEIVGSGSVAWAAFRRDHVRGGGTDRVEGLATLEPTRTAPAAVERGTTARPMTLVLTGGTEGYLENCGCKGNEHGGLARRATLIRTLRRTRPNVVLLDAGSTFSRSDKQPTLDTLSREELRFSLRTVAGMRYDAIAVGTTELIYGLPVFRALTANLELPFVTASVAEESGAIAPPLRWIERGGLRIAVIGLLEPSRGLDIDARFEDATAGMRLSGPLATARAVVPRLAREADLVIALGKLGPVTIRRLVEACPELDVIVSTDDQMPIPGPDGDIRDRPGFLGRTLVLYTDQTRYGVNLARLDVGRQGRVIRADLEALRLDDRVRDDPEVRRLLTDLYERIGRLDAAQGAVQSPFAGDPVRMAGAYVGARACAGCHASEYAQWRDTPHATAYKTLLDVHRHYQPRCVSCHVVGFGAPTGFRVSSPDEQLANVQCEVCHGPGGRHVREPGPSTIQRSVPEAVCLSCHTPDHSDHFVYRERLPRVLHVSSLAERQPLPPSLAPVADHVLKGSQGRR